MTPAIISMSNNIFFFILNWLNSLYQLAQRRLLTIKMKALLNKNFLTLSSIIGRERSMKGSFTVEILKHKKMKMASEYTHLLDSPIHTKLYSKHIFIRHQNTLQKLKNWDLEMEKKIPTVQVVFNEHNWDQQLCC